MFLCHGHHFDWASYCWKKETMLIWWCSFTGRIHALSCALDVYPPNCLNGLPSPLPDGISTISFVRLIEFLAADLFCIPQSQGEVTGGLFTSQLLGGIFAWSGDAYCWNLSVVLLSFPLPDFSKTLQVLCNGSYRSSQRQNKRWGAAKTPHLFFQVPYLSSPEVTHWPRYSWHHW